MNLARYCAPIAYAAIVAIGIANVKLFDRPLNAGERLLTIVVICVVSALLATLYEQVRNVPPDPYGNNINALGRSLDASRSESDD